jgi:putative membrane protein (TIGR04086 family)
MKILCGEGIIIMTKRKSEEEQGTVLLCYGKVILIGGAIAFAVGLALLFLAAAGVSRGLLDPGLRYQLTVVSCVLGSFTGGVVAVRNSPARGLIVGLAAGAVLFLFQLSLGLILFEGFSLESGGVGLLFGDLCGGAAAGILSGGGKKRKTPRTKKRRIRP